MQLIVARLWRLEPQEFFDRDQRRLDSHAEPRFFIVLDSRRSRQGLTLINGRTPVSEIVSFEPRDFKMKTLS
jgi:hypothetical protein